MNFHSDNFELFTKSRFYNNGKRLTRSQKDFAEFLLINYKRLQVVGDLEYVFSQVRAFLKTNPELWVEHTIDGLSERQYDNIIDDNSDSFDWSIPMKSLEKLYPPNGVVAEIFKSELKEDELCLVESDYFHEY